MSIVTSTMLITALRTLLLALHVADTHGQSPPMVARRDNSTTATTTTVTMTTTASTTTTRNSSDTELDGFTSLSPRTRTEFSLLVCMFAECFVPENNPRGNYSVDYADDCTPYLTASCEAGYTETNDIYYCIIDEWVPSINDEGLLCAKNCDPLTVPPNTDAFHSVNYSLISDTEQAFPSESKVIYQCGGGTVAGSLDENSLLSYSVCHDGEWTGPEVSLDCSHVEPMACKDQGAAVIVLGVFCGVQGLIILLLVLWIFMKWRHVHIDKGNMTPNAEIRANPYTTRNSGVPMPPPPSIPRGPPPRPPARTDTAVVGKDIQDYSYAYADVQNGNHVAPKEDVEATNKNGEKSIPAYLEIIN